MLARLKKFIVGSRLERLARGLYIRLDPSPGSQYDRLTLAIMRRYLQRDSNCIDIGAHRGTILAEIIDLAPDGRHFAFEPIPQHSNYLASSFPKVQVHQIALDNIKRQTEFVHDRSHPTRSSFKQPLTANEEIETIMVQTDLVDNIIPPTLPIHFIKIDVEGAEYQVLQGAVNTIRAHKPVIVFEHTHVAQECYKVSPEMIYTLLTQDCGLHISRLRDWLHHKAALSQEAFQSEVTQAKELYFIAYS